MKPNELSVATLDTMWPDRIPHDAVGTAKATADRWSQLTAREADVNVTRGLTSMRHAAMIHLADGGEFPHLFQVHHSQSRPVEEKGGKLSSAPKARGTVP